jgi:hypothetical protein
MIEGSKSMLNVLIFTTNIIFFQSEKFLTGYSGQSDDFMLVSLILNIICLYISIKFSKFHK